MKTTRNPIALNSILALALGVFFTQSTALAGPAVIGSGEAYLATGPPPVLGAPVDGWTAKILRNDKGVTINIHAVGLNPHHAYTVWLVELGAGPPKFLTGHIVGGSGTSTFSGRLAAQNPVGGEFHAVIADHGPIDELDPPLPAAIKTPAGSSFTRVVIFEP